MVESVGHLLVGIRPEGVPLAGKSEFPGGKCQQDETSRSAAVRECREETGLMVVPREHLVTTTHDYDHGAVELDFWRCALSPDVQDLAAPREPFQWVRFKDLSTHDFPSGNNEVLKLLMMDSTTSGRIHPRLEQCVTELAHAFREAERPDHFTNYQHCDDCAAHDETLRQLSVGKLRLEHVGNPAIDPISFVTEEAFRYLLPGLAQIAIAWPEEYFVRFLGHLLPERIRHFTDAEYRALVHFLKSLRAEADRQDQNRSGLFYEAAGVVESSRPVFRTEQKLAELKAMSAFFASGMSAS